MGTALKFWVVTASLAVSACATPPHVVNITYPLETGVGFNTLEPVELVGPALQAIFERAAG